MLLPSKGAVVQQTCLWCLADSIPHLQIIIHSIELEIRYAAAVEATEASKFKLKYPVRNSIWEELRGVADGLFGGQTWKVRPIEQAYLPMSLKLGNRRES